MCLYAIFDRNIKKKYISVNSQSFSPLIDFFIYEIQIYDMQKM